MLVNGCNIIMYKYQDRKNLELVDISSYKALLESKVSFTDNIALEPYSFEELMSYELQEKFTQVYVGCETPKDFVTVSVIIIRLRPVCLLQKIERTKIKF